MNASVNGCVFAENKGGDCRNIYSENPNVNITHTTFDTENVDYAVSDIDYGKTETINGTIDIPHFKQSNRWRLRCGIKCTKR